MDGFARYSQCVDTNNPLSGGKISPPAVVSNPGPMGTPSVALTPVTRQQLVRRVGEDSRLGGAMCEFL
jgi:hypothetical protein